MSGHYTGPGTRCRSRPSMRAHSAGWLAGTVDRDDDGGRPCWWSVGPVGRLVEGLSRPVQHAHLPRRAAAPVVCWWRGGAGGEWWAGRAERSLTRGGPERDGALRLQRCWDRPMGTWRPLSTKVLYAWDPRSHAKTRARTCSFHQARVHNDWQPTGRAVAARRFVPARSGTISPKS